MTCNRAYLAGSAVPQSQAAINEIVLHVHHNES